MNFFIPPHPMSMEFFTALQMDSHHHHHKKMRGKKKMGGKNTRKEMKVVWILLVANLV